MRVFSKNTHGQFECLGGDFQPLDPYFYQKRSLDGATTCVGMAFTIRGASFATLAQKGGLRDIS